jgi:hypothetical protein
LLLGCALVQVPEQPQVLYADETPLRINVNVEVFGLDASIIPSYAVFQALYERRRDCLDFCRACLFAAAVEYHDAGHNLLVSQGLNFIVDRIIGSSVTYIGYCGVGTGTNAAAATDTTLQTQVGTRQVVTNPYRGTTGRAHFDTFFEAVSTWNGAITETGLFKDSTTSGTDVLLARKIIDTFTKTTSNAMMISWLITFTPG